MYRIHPETDELLVPHLFEDGAYGAADPALGKLRHHISNRVAAASLEELRGFLARGWPIWMSIQGTRDRRLISKGIVDGDPPVAHRPEAAPLRPPIPAEAGEVIAANPTHVNFSKEEHRPAALPTAWMASAAKTDEAVDRLRIIASLSEDEIEQEIEAPRRLLMGSHLQGQKRLDIAYAPFDHVNLGADIVIVGITPGRQQMREAIAEARRAMALGLPLEEVLALAKVHASFAGAMRANLVKLMDAVGVNDLLGIRSAASLWGIDGHRAHFTSALRYPTFIDGENYNRTPDMNNVPFLFDRARKWLKEELSQFPDAVIVPMGDMVAGAIERIGRETTIPKERILSGMPHASGANNGPISRFLGAKGEGDEWRARFREVAGKVEALSATRPRP